MCGLGMRSPLFPSLCGQQLLVLLSLLTTTQSMLMENENDKTYVFAPELAYEFFA